MTGEEKKKVKKGAQVVKVDDQPTVGEVVENLPPEAKKGFQAFFASMSRTTTMTPRGNPIFEKFNAKHIDKFLDNVQNDKNSQRRYYFAYTIVALIVLGLGVVYLGETDKDLLIQIITILVAFAGGYGLGKSSG